MPAQPAISQRLEKCKDELRTAINRAAEVPDTSQAGFGGWDPVEEQSLIDLVNALSLLLQDTTAALTQAQQDLTNCQNS